MSLIDINWNIAIKTPFAYFSAMTRWIYCNKRRGLIYAEFIVGIVQQIFSYQLSGINCKYHAYAIILLPVIA